MAEWSSPLFLMYGEEDGWGRNGLNSLTFFFFLVELGSFLKLSDSFYMRLLNTLS